MVFAPRDGVGVGGRCPHPRDPSRALIQDRIHGWRESDHRWHVSDDNDGRAWLVFFIYVLVVTTIIAVGSLLSKSPTGGM